MSFWQWATLIIAIISAGGALTWAMFQIVDAWSDAASSVDAEDEQ